MLNEIYEFFLKVSEMGSISKAADKLYISQPALSQQLKNLEKELDASLFIRSNKGIELTGEGKIVYKYFSMSEKLLQEMKKEIRDKKNNVKKIRISAVPTMCNYSLPCMIYHLKQHYPNTSVELYSRSDSFKIEEELVSERCDIGFVAEDIKNDLVLTSKKIFEEEILLVASNISINYPDFITERELSRYDLINMATENEITRTVSRYINDFESYKITYNLESIDAIKSCVVNGYGLAFLPYSTIKKELYNKEMKIINIDNLSIVQNISLVKRVSETDGLKKIISYIEKHVSKFI
ncbi:LysR family transcriptional regulator [Pseudoleptotrichia goodfellowii]|uniref:Transcriptional regulator, LysR family n=2 Tax=Pseudoleptotrichia goodfellowii TaxID=157692 RepID=D0GM40_9FUSO|nr:LysR family transcriptional regulator [Pseudoleptotrichia goodfellowii]EEY34826.1 transcriptional regulator, LysR family [Pseudoleptotrichia goodfellowii F0264]BBM35883.1 transcriptional regulator, LysR family [Pseudoleptotrichia goodfellowii]